MTQNSNLQKSKITHWCQFTTNDITKRSTECRKNNTWYKQQCCQTDKTSKNADK